ncbi:MAG: terminase small subunit [Faecousia sp.]
MAEKKYTPRALKKAVAMYFASISRNVAVTERKPTGAKDSYGHEVFEDVPVKNGLGEEMFRTEYLVPPTVLGLCLYLGIHRDTWNSYCRNPEYSDTTTHARGRMQCWREEELHTRKEVRGLIWDLENNYGFKEQSHPAATGKTVEELLAEEGELTF